MFFFHTAPATSSPKATAPPRCAQFPFCHFQVKHSSIDATHRRAFLTNSTSKYVPEFLCKYKAGSLLTFLGSRKPSSRRERAHYVKAWRKLQQASLRLERRIRLLLRVAMTKARYETKQTTEHRLEKAQIKLTEGLAKRRNKPTTHNLSQNVQIPRGETYSFNDSTSNAAHGHFRVRRTCGI